jgi:hypothetical protein
MEKKVSLFVSRSFNDADHELNAWFIEICKGLGIELPQIGNADAAPPISVCREKIIDSQGVLAILVRREKVGDEDYLMPDHCRDEVSMAYAVDKPLLIFAEKGVRMNGFVDRIGTHQRFDRAALGTPEYVGKIILALNKFKDKSAAGLRFRPDSGRSDVRALQIYQLIDLQRKSGDWNWHLVTKKRIEFLSVPVKPIPTAVWSTSSIVPPEGAPLVKFKANVCGGSKPFRVIQKMRIHTALRAEGEISFAPQPEPGDWVEYEIVADSRYLNPLTSAELGASPISTNIDGRDYFVCEGFLPVQPTAQLTIELRFEPGYTVANEDLSMFAGPYADGLEALDQDEMSRMSFSDRTVGGERICIISIEKPKERFMYGIGWNPPDLVLAYDDAADE